MKKIILSITTILILIFLVISCGKKPKAYDIYDKFKFSQKIINVLSDSSYYLTTTVTTNDVLFTNVVYDEKIKFHKLEQIDTLSVSELNKAKLYIQKIGQMKLNMDKNIQDLE